MSKYRIDKRRMKRRAEYSEGRTIVLVIAQALGSLLLFSISPYLVPVELLLLLFAWMYLAGKNQYYTWQRYLAIVALGTLLGLSLFYAGGGR